MRATVIVFEKYIFNLSLLQLTPQRTWFNNVFIGLNNYPAFLINQQGVTLLASFQLFEELVAQRFKIILHVEYTTNFPPMTHRCIYCENVALIMKTPHHRSNHQLP